MRSSKVLSSIAISSMLILTAMVMVLPTNTQAAWSDSATMTFSPAELFPGETHTASYTISLGAAEEGVTQLTISNVWVQYEWELLPHDVLAATGARTVSSFPSPVVITDEVQVPAAQAKGDYTVNATVWAYTNGVPSSLVTHTFEEKVKVSDPITATATADPATGLSPAEISFDVTASGGTSPYTYSWNFGDGSAASTQKNPKHTYTVGGTFTATVTVTDDLGRTNRTQTSAITITPGVTVAISARPMAGPFPLEVTFNNTVTNAADGDLTYAWDFGDEGTSTESAPTHTFTKAGNYSVKLNVTDSLDRKGTSNTLTIKVSASVNPIVTVSASAVSGHGPLNVRFTSSVEGGTEPYEYLWTFDDGSTSTEASPSHTFQEPGIYVVTLAVTDSANHRVVSDELTITVVSDTTMEVLINATALSGTYPMTVSFSSTVLNGTGPYFYRWSFGDGVNSTQANPVHVYEEAGDYAVTLTVTDSNSNVSIAHDIIGNEQLLIVVTAPAAASLPAWVWIWSATAVIIAVVGIVGFVMMRRRM